ncbi:hypothetical protein L195_g062443, partial [Trifolium pratense]
ISVSKCTSNCKLLFFKMLSSTLKQLQEKVEALEEEQNMKLKPLEDGWEIQ